MRHLALAVLVLLAAGCSATVDPTNPFDPASSQTPPSSGSIVIDGGAAATGQQVVPVAISAVGAFEMRLSVNGAPVTAWIPYATSADVDLGATPDSSIRVVSVDFRTPAELMGGGASASIFFDRTPPAAPGLTLLGALAGGAPSTAFSAGVAITAELALPTDATLAQMTLSEQSGSCALPPSAIWQPAVPNVSVVLTGGDGARQVCAWLRDEAGNVSPPASASITLDTSTPTNPAFTSLSSGITNQPTVSGDVTAIGDATTTAVYQCFGGQYGSAWVDCSGAPPFAFTLAQNQSNTLGVRARDLAYNCSAGSLVTIVHDDVPPVAPFITTVRTTRTSLVLAWNPSPDTDVASYRVYYGNSAGDFSGTGADQGPSPVYAGPASVTNFTLTGLSTGRPYYVAVEAVDGAGNASGPSGQRAALPGKVNPRVLSAIGGRLRAPAVRAGGGHTFVYVAQNQGVVQLQVDSDAAAPITTGRASVPNLAPDEQAPLQVVDCTSSGVAGHCVIPTGATLEGDARSDFDDFRANPPVVFFPFTGTASAPSLGLEIAALPARPHRLIAATIGSQPGIYAVERGAVKAYSLSNPLYPRLLWTAPVPIAAQTVLGAGLVGAHLLVYAQAANAAPHLLDFDATGASLVAVDRGVLNAYDGATALGAPVSAMPDPFIVFQGGSAFYVAYSNTLTSNTYLSSYTTASPNPAATVTLFGDGGMGELEVLSATAGNGHAYVFAGNNGTPYVRQVTLVGTALTLGGSAAGPTPSSGAAGATVAVYGSGEHLVAVDGNGTDHSLQRWTVSGATLTRDANAFREVHNTWFAESDHFLFASQGASINTIDAANPLSPVVTSTYTSGAARSYGKLVVHGRYLLAIDATYPSAGIDVFRIGGNGVLALTNGGVPFGAAAGNQVNDLSVVGAWAFVAGSNGIWPYYFVSGSASGPYGPLSVTGGVLAIDARPYTNGASAGFLLYAAQFGPSLSQGALQTYTYQYPGPVAALSGALTLPGSFGMSIRARGPWAVVSDSSGSWSVYAGTPSSPYVSGQMLPVSGPVLLQGGYVVGLATSRDGPSFTVLGSGATDGTMLFSQCANQGGAGSLAVDSGVYFAGCQNNGLALVGVADPLGGALMKSYAVGESWTQGAALAGDGMVSWLGGATVSNVSTGLYDELETGNAAGTLYTPAASAAVVPGLSARWMLYSDGMDYVVASDGFSTTDLLAYETLPYGLHQRTTATQLQLALPGATLNQPVTDGERVFIGYDLYGSSGRIDVYDLRDTTYDWGLSASTSPAIGIESLAVARDRLYAGTNDGRILVWDVSTWDFTKPKATVALPTNVAITGIAVSGRNLFYTDRDGNLGVVLLGATDRDGSGASVVGTLATPFQIANPAIVGDVLYASGNLGTASYDLTPLWTGGAMPKPLGGASTDPPNLEPIRLYVDGPFAYLVGGVYRAFDLR